MNSAEVSRKLILMIIALVLFVLEWPPLSGSIALSEGSNLTSPKTWVILDLWHQVKPQFNWEIEAATQDDSSTVRHYSGQGNARDAAQVETDIGFIKGVWPIRRVYVSPQAQAIICWLYKNALRVRPR